MTRTTLSSERVGIARPGFSSLSDRVRQAVHSVRDLPRPGGGDTLGRWRALSAWGAESLPLAKILEAHYDALTILQEAGEPGAAPDTVWAVWAAAGPDDSLQFDAGRGTVSGIKPWCSADEAVVTHALITVESDAARPLCAVALESRHFRLNAHQWHGPGMRDVPTGQGRFSAAPARLVGDASFYLDRPGFWHGGAGIAACWYGAAAAIASRVRDSNRVANNSFFAAHLGAMDEGLTAARLMLHDLAGDIDRNPSDSHRLAVTRLRCFVDRICRDVMERAALALGPASLCTDADHAQRCADLAAFIRQCHGQRDEQWMGEALHREGSEWAL